MKKVFYKKQQASAEEFFSAYTDLSKGRSHHVLLESGRGGRYSICGIAPDYILQGNKNGLHIFDDSGSQMIMEGNPLECVKQWMGNHSVSCEEGLPDFQGGAIGFISYDYARFIEKLPEMAEDDLQTPILYFLVFNEAAVFDHEENVVWFLKIGTREESESCSFRIQQMKDDFNKSLSSKQKNAGSARRPVSPEPPAVSMSEPDFIHAVRRIRDYISQGDIFQVNLSVRQTSPLGAAPIDIYSCLRKLNPSPYMSYIHTPDFQVVSGSPELLVKKKGTKLSTRPIAGTRSRGRNDEEDLRLANELINSEKERAEHVMLVDLERNDLGKVCEYGSVEVNEFMVIEKYSHVMHIVSNVQGQLKEACDEYDVINAVFPGGTITGAPKVRTMEIIEELEPVRRGIYTGSIGWIGFNGDMELNIVIRTLFAKDGYAHIQAGAGIVIDSVPECEYKESLKKAAALWKAKEDADRFNFQGGCEQ